MGRCRGLPPTNPFVEHRKKRSQEVTWHGARKQLTTRWTTQFSKAEKTRFAWSRPFRWSRPPKGFVVLPSAFSEGPLCREAWREVKASVARIRATAHPMSLRIRAVLCDGGSWQSLPNEVRVPISATRVEIWRTIHLVRHLARARLVPVGPEETEIGVAVEPMATPSSSRTSNGGR
jgi:hypothetical protein